MWAFLLTAPELTRVNPFSSHETKGLSGATTLGNEFPKVEHESSARTQRGFTFLELAFSVFATLLSTLVTRLSRYS